MLDLGFKLFSTAAILDFLPLLAILSPPLVQLAFVDAHFPG